MGRLHAYGGLALITGVALGATVFHSDIAQAVRNDKPSQPVLVANTPAEAVPVREQNLDGNTNVKVHEQGTADVRVTNTVPVSGAVSVSGSVNVGNLPTSDGKLEVISAPAGQRAIMVASNTTVPANTAWHTGFRDTSDCQALAAFVRTSFSLDDSDVSLWMTASTIATSLATTGGIRVQEAWYFRAGSSSLPVFTPKAEVVIVNGHDSPGTITEAWLICSR